MASLNGFLWKPESTHTGKLAVVFPSHFASPSSISLRLANGRIIQGKLRGRTNGNRPTYDFPHSGAQYGSNITLIGPDGNPISIKNGSKQVQNNVTAAPSRLIKQIQNLPKSNAPAASPPAPGTRYANPAVQSRTARNENDTTEPALGPNPTGASVGTATSGDSSSEFPVAGKAPDFPNVEAPVIPQIQVPVVDPIDRTKEVGDFNTGVFQNDLALGSKEALDLQQLEFQGISNFYPQASALQRAGVATENVANEGEVAGANAFNRGELPAANQFNEGQIAEANQFNQQQRLQQLETALPGARDLISAEIKRAGTLAEGRFATDAEDRAYEVASRSIAGDNNVVRGFGDDSVIGRRTSDLLSAEQRLNLSNTGSSRLNNALSLGANLEFDQPIKHNPVLDQPLKYQPLTTRTSQDIRGTPSTPASTLAIQQQQSLLPLTTITPSAAIGFDVNQNQFQANLTQDTNKFNASNNLHAQEFNATGNFQSDLEQFSADNFNAQQQANAHNAAGAADLAQSNFEGASTTNAITTGAGALLGLAGGLLSGGGGGGGLATLAGLLRGGQPGTADSVASGSTSALGDALREGSPGTAANSSAVPIGETTLDNGAPAYELSDGSVVAQTSYTPQAATLTPTSLASYAVPLGLAAVAYTSGRGIQDTVKGLTDGSITKEDMKQALGDVLGPSNPAMRGIDNILGKPVSKKDINNAFLLSNPVTAPLALADMVGLGGSGKSKQQKTRDVLRDHGQDIGLFFKPDDAQVQNGLQKNSHYVELADGSAYNVGKDGGAKLKNYGQNIDGKNERFTYDIDWSDPRASRTVAYANPLALIAFGNNYQKMMGHVVNAATSNNNSLSETKRNLQKMAGDMNLDYQTGLKILDRYKGKLTPQEYSSFVSGWNEMMLSKGTPNDIVI